MVGFFFLVVPTLRADDWRGFHGLEKEGRSESATVPSVWSSSENVAWKTTVPGRGHSSPIVSGDSVYVTTAYDKASTSALVNVWHHAVFGLSMLFAVAGINLLAQDFGPTQKKTARAAQYVRVFLFVQFCVGIIVVSLFGRRLLNPEDVMVRRWLVSIAMVLSCQAVSSLSMPLKSRQQLFVALLSCPFTILAFLTLRQGGLGFGPRSSKGVVLLAAAVSPLILGLVLCLVHLVNRARCSPQMKIGRDPTGAYCSRLALIVAGVAGAGAGLLPFFLLLFRAADYRMPDSYIFDTRVRPDLGWVAVAVYMVVIACVGAVSLGRPARDGIARRFPWQKGFFVVALLLGLTYCIGIRFSGGAKQSVRAVVCFDANDGDIRWVCEGLVAPPRRESRIVTHASATPVTDGERIYGYFGQEGLMCVSSQGVLLWRLTDPIFRDKFGVGNSPVLKDGVLVLLSDVGACESLPSSIAAYDCISGTRLWKETRMSHEAHAAYSTPLLRVLNGYPAVIAHGWHDIRAYDVKTGHKLCAHLISHDGDHLVASLVSDSDRLYVLDAREVRALALSQLASDGDPLVWSTPLRGEKSSTPVVVDGLLFVVTEAGTVCCLDALTGELLWKERLKGRYFSSVVAAGGKVFFTNQVGVTTVLAIDREFRLLASNALGESVYASLVPTEGRLFVRGTKHLYCIREDKQS